MNIGSIASKGWNYIQRAGRIYPDFVMGTGNEAFTQVMRSTIKNRAANGQTYMQSVWSGIKDGARAAERHNNILNKQQGGFWKSTWHALKTTPKKIAQGWRVGGKLADRAGKTGLSKIWSQFKGSLSGIGKRMPLIFSLMVVLPELPNIFSAFKDKGLVGGVAETGKTQIRYPGRNLQVSSQPASASSPLLLYYYDRTESTPCQVKFFSGTSKIPAHH